jgi:tRNA pseudouridine55 synthase
VHLTCSAGFYVRSFAHSLGEIAGTGACLQALRRTRSGDFTLADAVSLEEVVRAPSLAAQRLVPMRQLLTGLPAVRVSPEERRRVAHGQLVHRPAPADWVRLLDDDGQLVAVAQPAEGAGSLHPAVVLI